MHLDVTIGEYVKVVDLEVVEQVEPEQLLSVFDTLLKECGQERILTLNEAISDFRQTLLFPFESMSSMSLW